MCRGCICGCRGRVRGSTGLVLYVNIFNCKNMRFLSVNQCRGSIHHRLFSLNADWLVPDDRGKEAYPTCVYKGELHTSIYRIIELKGISI